MWKTFLNTKIECSAAASFLKALILKRTKKGEQQQQKVQIKSTKRNQIFCNSVFGWTEMYVLVYG